jgi:peptidoglycan LD-endopeptidase LytH
MLDILHRMRRRLRASLVVVAVVSAFVSMVLTPHVALAETPAEQAAREIADARERVNELAEQIFAAELRIEELELASGQLETEIGELQADIDELRLAVETVAVDRFTQSGSQGVPLLTGFTSPVEQVKINELLSVVTTSADEAFELLDSMVVDLDEKSALLAEQRNQADAERTNLETLRQQAEDEVTRLREVEEQRLKDEQVRLALEAELRERARVQELERQRAASLAPAAATQPAAAPGQPKPAAVPVVAGAVGPSEETGGGRTGGGGSGGTNSGGIAFNVGPGWFCPTGPHAAPFSDTWGAARSGGRRHQGVDMIAARGTPLYAVEDGVVTQKSNTLGGLTISLMGASGTRYYYAHLDSYGAAGPVVKGTVVGYVGDTGNAKYSTPHLHFEIRPGNGDNVNPYPTTAAHCPSAP